MTTPAEAAADLYGQLKPDARVIAVEWVMARTPADLQEEMLALIEADLVEAGGEPGQNEPPTVVDAPMIYQVGSVITCTMGNWNGDPDSRTYEWQADGVAIAGANSEPNYSVKAADIGTTITCVMTATNPVGTSAPVTSNSIVAV